MLKNVNIVENSHLIELSSNLKTKIMVELDYDVWRCYVRDHIESSLENIEVWQCV